MSTNSYDIIIVGGGAAGLIAAYELAQNNKRVLILEAQNRLGGRIHTVTNQAGGGCVELGAEFIHGDLPYTFDLLKKGQIAYHKTGGRMWQANTRVDLPVTGPDDHWNLFEERLKELREDTTIAALLNTYFAGDEYTVLRASVEGFASGYDTADPKRASALALRDEWLDEDFSAQYRLEKGYGAIIDFLQEECVKGGCDIKLSCIVKEIKWSTNSVEAITGEGKRYWAGKAIITVPPGVLMANKDEPAALSFTPAIPEQMEAVKMIGYGAVLKVILQFEKNFLETIAVDDYPGDNLKDVGFILSSQAIPTWWTQYPKESGLMTGWLGGPNAEKLKHAIDEEIMLIALESLAGILKMDVEVLNSRLYNWQVANWTAEPFALGSYSYATLDTAKGRDILNEPVQDTLFFCGEALAIKSETGTVEAAFESGVSTAKKILSR